MFPTGHVIAWLKEKVITLSSHSYVANFCTCVASKACARVRQSVSHSRVCELISMFASGSVLGSLPRGVVEAFWKGFRTSQTHWREGRLQRCARLPPLCVQCTCTARLSSRSSSGKMIAKPVWCGTYIVRAGFFFFCRAFTSCDGGLGSWYPRPGTFFQF